MDVETDESEIDRKPEVKAFAHGVAPLLAKEPKGSLTVKPRLFRNTTYKCIDAKYTFVFLFCSPFRLCKMFGIRLHIWGERACFTRPEFKAERVSYDVPTPSAARGLIEAIYWKPAIRWVIDRIHVLKPIRFQSIVRNEVGSKASAVRIGRAMQRGSVIGLPVSVGHDRQQRHSLILTDVAYVIEAHFELTTPVLADENPGKHLSIFSRRAERGQCFHQPCLGTREFAAQFAWLAPGVTLPAPDSPSRDRGFGRPRDLGPMLWDIDHESPEKPSLMFRAQLRDGVIDVPPPGSAELLR